MMNRKNYKEDFSMLLLGTDRSGKNVGFPRFNWKAVFYTALKSVRYVASYIDGVCTNCVDDNDRIRIVFNSHQLPPGILKVEFHQYIPDEEYPDRTKDLFLPKDLDIELVYGESDIISDLEVKLMLPYIKGDKGEPFTWEDFTPEQIAELQKPATDAAKEADATVATLKQDAEATVASLKQDAEATVSQLKQDTAQTVSTLKAEAETAISGMKEDLREMAKYGSYSIDFGKEADTAEDFNMEDADIEIQEISAINVASVAVANGDSVIDVDVSDFAPFRIKSKNRAVWTITRMDDELSSAIGIKFKTIN